jgi:3'-phosphoadenosine 5'-phosphosulfate (PAPS) 3'-phosphatase
MIKRKKTYYKYIHTTKSEKKRIIASKDHSNDIIKSSLKKIPNSEIQYRGGCGFKSILLIENMADCFLHAGGYKRYV